MTAFIEHHRDRFGVEPICRVTESAPSTYYAARHREPSRRALRDEHLKDEIKPCAQTELRRQRSPQDLEAAQPRGHHRGTLHGSTSHTRTGAAWRKARQDDHHDHARRDEPPSGRLGRARLRRGSPQPALGRRPHLRAHLRRLLLRRPGDRRVFPADRRLVARHHLAHRDAPGGAGDGALASWARPGGSRTSLGPRLPVHLDPLHRAFGRGRHRALGGSAGDAYDNALAESTIGLYKTELVDRQGPWRTPQRVEIATLEYFDWWNNRRLHTEIGDILPAEKEAIYYADSEREERELKEQELTAS